MRILKLSRLREYWTKHRRAKASLEDWFSKARVAEWQRFEDVRATFASADDVKVASGRKVVVFNIGGNNYRLITAIHYNHRKVFILRFLTHAEYDQQRWKADL